MKHLKQHLPILSIIFFVVLISLTLGLIYDCSVFLHGYAILVTAIAAGLYASYQYESNQKELISDYNAKEITDLKDEIKKHKEKCADLEFEYNKKKISYETLNNKNILLKRENEKLKERTIELSGELAIQMVNNKKLMETLTELEKFLDNKDLEADQIQDEHNRFMDVHFGDVNAQLDNITIKDQPGIKEDDPYKRVFGVDTIADQPDIPPEHFGRANLNEKEAQR